MLCGQIIGACPRGLVRAQASRAPAWGLQIVGKFRGLSGWRAGAGTGWAGANGVGKS